MFAAMALMGIGYIILSGIMAAQIISFVFVLMVYYYKNRKGN